MEKIVVVGAGGFSREVAEIFKDQAKLNSKRIKKMVIGFVDDDPKFIGKSLNGIPILGNIDWLIEKQKDAMCVVAIGDPKIKKNIVEKLIKANMKFTNAIHPSVIMSDSVVLGEGDIICAGCVLTVNIRIGNHVILNLLTTIGHDAVIDDYCSIMPGVRINGENHLHQGVYVGTGSSFAHQVEIGEWSTLGAGAVVIGDIPDHVLAVGVPATVKKKLV